MSILPKFIQNFFSWVKGLVAKVTPEVKTVVEIGIHLVENIKTYVDSPGVDALTAIIPGQADDAIVKAIRAFLPGLLAKLQFVEGELDNDQIVEFIDKLQNASDDAAAIFAHGIASAVNNLISDNIGSISQAFLTTEVVYKSESPEVKQA